jgi:hypothetical protein
VAGTPKGKVALEALRTNEKKWSKEVMEAGWVAFPSILLEKQQAIGLTPTDVNIILHLVSYWWTAENKPYPSKASIAAAIGVQPRTVQRRIAALEQARLIQREERRTSKNGSDTNRYHLDGLIEALKPYALEKLEIRKLRKAEDEIRRNKKGRPHLRVV